MKHVLGDASRLRVPLDDRRAALLLAFTDLLAERAVPLGLVGGSDRGRLYRRHVLDSLGAAAAFEPGDRAALDLGSGAGLPGVVLAVALPGVRFVLLEPRARRAGFLELAVDRLGLENAEVRVARAEDLVGEAPGVDVVTARAFAPLPRSWAAAHPLLRPGGRLVYFVGERTGDPGAEARAVADPESPTEVRTVLEKERRLAIMVRG